MLVQVRRCDLCGADIVRDNSHNAYIFDGDYQEWPSESGIYDVCGICCIVLKRATAYGLIQLDKNKLMEHDGYHLKDGWWERVEEDGIPSRIQEGWI